MTHTNYIVSVLVTWNINFGVALYCFFLRWIFTNEVSFMQIIKSKLAGLKLYQSQIDFNKLLDYCDGN